MDSHCRFFGDMDFHQAGPPMKDSSPDREIRASSKRYLNWREQGHIEFSILFLDFGGEAAAVELDGDGVADLNFSRRAEEVAGGVGGDGVAAFEDFQGAAFLELQREALTAFALGAQESLGAGAEIGAAFFKAQTERGDFHAKIKRDDADMRGGEAFARLFEARAKAEGEARCHLIGALALLAEEIERAAKAAGRGKLMDAA